MSQILPEKTADAAYKKIQSMLATLGDPFTRLVSPQVYILIRFQLSNNPFTLLVYPCSSICIVCLLYSADC